MARRSDKRRVAAAQLEGARARLADQRQRGAAPEVIAEIEQRIVELEAIVGQTDGRRSIW